jgi:hypothetical protein
MARKPRLRYTARIPGPFMKIVVIIFLVLIVGSLGSALFYLVTGRGESRRMARALAIRVGLSVTLFLILMAGYYFGLIPGKIL